MPIYSGEHSITFGEKNTWDDWHLIPSSRPVFSPPQPNIRLLNIPGKSGSLDVTDVFGPVVYADRTGSFEFYVDHETGFPSRDNEPWSSWTEAYYEIMQYLHGKKLKAVLKDDPKFYYEGRFSVNEWRSNANFSTIVINYTVQPYKMQHYYQGWDWIWDKTDFNDKTKKLSPLSNILISKYGTSGVEVKITGYGYRSIPVINCTDSGVQMYFDDQDPITLNAGDNRPSIAVITEGEHKLRFVGTGLVDVYYRSGAL